MTIEKELVKGFETAHAMAFGTKFYKADLHFHTPASEDARGKTAIISIHIKSNIHERWKIPIIVKK